MYKKQIKFKNMDSLRVKDWEKLEKINMIN
jgi:hypothetical protein